MTSTTLEINDKVTGNELYTKETPEVPALYLGTLKQLDNVWNLVSIDEMGNVVAVEYATTAKETLTMLKDEIQSISIDDVKTLNALNCGNMKKIASFIKD